MEFYVAIKDVVAIDISQDAAIEILERFHNATRQAVLDAFFNLRNKQCPVWRFTPSVNGSVDCFSLRGFDTEGKYVCFESIDRYTGQPKVIVG